MNDLGASNPAGRAGTGASAVPSGRSASNAVRVWGAATLRHAITALEEAAQDHGQDCLTFWNAPAASGVSVDLVTAPDGKPYL